MNKCQHGRSISVFCLSDHCQSKQTGGCQDCFKKYHNHIGQISSINQEEVKKIVKKFQIESNYRPKSRNLQQVIFSYCTHLKSTITTNLDYVCKNIINEIGYPYLHGKGILSCYKRLKNKQYRKVTQKELKQLYEIYNTVRTQDIVKQQKNIYSQAISRIQSLLVDFEKKSNQILEQLQKMSSSKSSNLLTIDKTLYMNISQTFKQIKKYPQIIFPTSTKIQQNSKNDKNEFDKIKLIAQPLNSRKLTRDVSLDKHIKFQSKLKTQIKLKKDDQFQFKIIQSQTAKQLDSKNSEMKLIQFIDIPTANLLDRQKLQIKKRTSKYSFQLNPDQINIRSPQQYKDQQFSQKEEQIIQRKKKLMQLMSVKPAKKQVDEKQQSSQSLFSNLTSSKRQSYIKTMEVKGALKQFFSPDSSSIKKQFLTPSLKKESSSKDNLLSIYRNRNQTTLNRLKNSSDNEQLQLSARQQQKSIKNYTLPISETDTEQLFNANIHIPIDEGKHQDFQPKEQSYHKCIVIPGITQTNEEKFLECQSPLLKKIKEIQNFSAMIKLAESKILDDQKETTKQKIYQFQSVNSPIRLNQVQFTKEQPKIQKNQLQNESVQISDNQQKSIALLLHSLKLPLSDAIKTLQKSLCYSSNNLSTVQYLSYLYLQASRPQDCLRLCNDLLKNISTSQTNQLAIRLNINKSAALNQLGRYSEGITFLERCLKYRHNDILYKNLADAYYSIGILEKAIYNYQHAIIQNASNTQAHYNLAVCHYLQENFHNASIYIDKAIKHQPTNEAYKQMLKHIEEKISIQTKP